MEKTNENKVERESAGNAEKASKGCGKYFRRNNSIITCGRERRDGDIELCSDCKQNTSRIEG